jgi:riboflavin kinase/FMN adenylyltransferase
MLVEEELARQSPDKDTVLTIGVFDGVHLGHKHLLSQLKEKAGEQNLLTGVVTFRQHPQEVLSPQVRLPFLTDLSQRIRLLKDEGIDIVVVLSFSDELARLGAREFAILLKKHLRMQGLLIGPDFALGKNREGDISTLRTLGQEMNFSLSAIPPVMINGEVVSSTTIRRGLAQGDMGKVHNLLGHYFSLHGHIITGAGRGRGLGFPTANLEVDSKQALPPDGVYATLAHLDNGTYQSVTNIGKRPTFGSGEHLVEAYILDYQGDLYGQELQLDIIERLRNEKQFANPEELKEQITKDIAQGRAILGSGREVGVCPER